MWTEVWATSTGSVTGRYGEWCTSTGSVTGALRHAQCPHIRQVQEFLVVEPVETAWNQEYTEKRNCLTKYKKYEIIQAAYSIFS